MSNHTTEDECVYKERSDGTDAQEQEQKPGLTLYIRQQDNAADKHGAEDSDYAEGGNREARVPFFAVFTEAIPFAVIGIRDTDDFRDRVVADFPARGALHEHVFAERVFLDEPVRLYGVTCVDDALTSHWSRPFCKGEMHTAAHYVSFLLLSQYRFDSPDSRRWCSEYKVVPGGYPSGTLSLFGAES